MYQRQIAPHENNGKFGNMPNCKWKPWPYRQRLDMAKQVSKFKGKISPNLAKSTQRSKVTQFIANKNSRQEFEPLFVLFVIKRLSSLSI